MKLKIFINLKQLSIMKTYNLERNQMMNPVVQELFETGRAKWDKDSWNGLEFESGFAKMSKPELERFNEIFEENNLLELKV